MVTEGPAASFWRRSIQPVAHTLARRGSQLCIVRGSLYYLWSARLLALLSGSVVIMRRPQGEEGFETLFQLENGNLGLSSGTIWVHSGMGF